MTITSNEIIDKIEVLEDGEIQVRQALILTDSSTNKEITRTFNRWVVVPGQDISSQDAKVQSIANVVWTQEVITAYQTKIASQQQISN
jgi:hypothetical protein